MRTDRLLTGGTQRHIPYLVTALYEIVRLGAAVGPAAAYFPFTSAINLINEANFIILSQSVSCLT